jgi:hypothetical protein
MMPVKASRNLGVVLTNFSLINRSNLCSITTLCMKAPTGSGG